MYCTPAHVEGEHQRFCCHFGFCGPRKTSDRLSRRTKIQKFENQKPETKLLQRSFGTFSHKQNVRSFSWTVFSWLFQHKLNIRRHLWSDHFFFAQMFHQKSLFRKRSNCSKHRIFKCVKFSAVKAYNFQWQNEFEVKITLHYNTAYFFSLHMFLSQSDRDGVRMLCKTGSKVLCSKSFS